MTTTVDISRAAPLPTSPLTIYGSKAAGTPSLLRDGLRLPGRQPRTTWAPPSADMHGSVPLSSVLDNDLLRLTVRLAAADETAFQTAYDALADALNQFSYTVTVTLAGVARAWSAFPAQLQLANETRQPADAGLVVDYYAISIPVYPIPGA